MPSTVIKSYHYNSETQELNIVFVSGIEYIYSGAPQPIYDEFREAFSKGIFFNSRIKNSYPFERIEDDINK